MLVKFIGLQGVPLAGRFIYPGETREVTPEQLMAAAQAHPGWFEVDGAATVVFPSPIEPVLEHGDEVVVS